jgi:lycopene beta-cyclase
VHLDDGSALHGKIVIDARGLDSAEMPEGAGFQKFLGLELLLESEHGITTPILMDACIEQIEGFRFMYVLPFGPRRLFVEDTYFCESPQLDVTTVEARIRSYCEAQGFRIADIGRRERGVLPMPWQAQPQGSDSAICLGVRGNWYHPATAYSVPCAVRTALAVASAAQRGEVLTKLAALKKNHEQQAKFARFLNRMLFRCFAPEKRVHVFERFYRLPEETIRRFYALDMTISDRVRILSGRPPRGFSLGRVLREAARG